MARRRFQPIEDKNHGFFSNPQMGFQWNLQESCFSPGGLFASVSQVGVGFGISPSHPDSVENSGKIAGANLLVKYVLNPELAVRIAGFPVDNSAVRSELKKKKWGGLKIKFKIKNPSLRRLISGAIAGAVSRSAVAPMETIRTHLMVGSNGHSTTEVFQNIMNTEGWTGLFRGNLVNVIRVAPSKAVEVCDACPHG